MSMLGDFWNRVTGKQPDKGEQPMSPHDHASVEAGKRENADRASQQANIAKNENVRQESKEFAEKIAAPGPAERMSYAQMYSERAQVALTQERERQVVYEKDVAAGRVPTPIDKTVSRLPEKSSGPER